MRKYIPDVGCEHLERLAKKYKVTQASIVETAILRSGEEVAKDLAAIQAQNQRAVQAARGAR